MEMIGVKVAQVAGGEARAGRPRSWPILLRSRSGEVARTLAVAPARYILATKCYAARGVSRDKTTRKTKRESTHRLL